MNKRLFVAGFGDAVVCLSLGVSFVVRRGFVRVVDTKTVQWSSMTHHIKRCLGYSKR
uniref:Uncharacterized protein n=1 Tax=Candidatus Kentrum sp. LFY TaxID=2126342 RepID=A0A450V4F0_9GAMM|nr:MAG: hypothetical protein BECKLFY1418B_GA0070995_11523 [Candidatus Kentron sp. LFY]